MRQELSDGKRHSIQNSKGEEKFPDILFNNLWKNIINSRDLCAEIKYQVCSYLRVQFCFDNIRTKKNTTSRKSVPTFRTISYSKSTYFPYKLEVSRFLSLEYDRKL